MKALNDLEAAVNNPTATRQQIKTLLEEVRLQTNRRQSIIKLVQEALAQLRLDMKYLLFDLECTREEKQIALNELKQLKERHAD